MLFTKAVALKAFQISTEALKNTLVYHPENIDLFSDCIDFVFTLSQASLTVLPHAGREPCIVREACQHDLKILKISIY